MSSPPLPRWVIHLYDRLGWPGALALALLLATAFMQAWLLPSMRKQTQEAEASAHISRRALAQRVAREAESEASLTRWPTADETPQRLAVLLHTAAGLDLSLVGLNTQVDPSQQVPSRLAVTLTLRGSYASLRAYLESVLMSDGALAINNLRLHRDTRIAEGDGPSNEARVPSSLPRNNLVADLACTLYLDDGTAQVSTLSPLQSPVSP